jgi:Fe2+ transport system protein FeoA
MKETLTTCALCGHTYALEAHQGCLSCPLQPDCNIICCPVCGYSDVDPNKSKALRWLRSNGIIRRLRSTSRPSPSDQTNLTVADLPPGAQARILSFDAVDEDRREKLMSYGLAPGRKIRVLRHNPATILQVDQTELAIENEVARRILVKEPHYFGQRRLRRHLRRKRRRKRSTRLRGWRRRKRADKE